MPQVAIVLEFLENEPSFGLGFTGQARFSLCKCYDSRYLLTDPIS